jgi:hypothetical protein
MKYFTFQLRLILFFLVLPWMAGCQETETPPDFVFGKQMELVTPDDPNIVYHGRINFADALAPEFYWAGSGFTLWFEGTSIAVILDDKKGKEYNNYFNAIIDDDTSGIKLIQCTEGQVSYEIAQGLDPGIHKLQLFRRTDPTTPLTKFKGVEIDPDKQLIEPLEQQPSLKIEFYGNSITSGHGILDETRVNNDDRATWDNYLTYAAKTARALDADYRCISMSGIGVMVSWYDLVMPQLYDQLIPWNEYPKWDFSQWQADVVVINLFQNDSWLINNLPVVPNDEQRIEAYFNFIQSIREKYSDAIIICTLGNMGACRSGSKWPGYISSAVEKSRTELSDFKVFSMPMTYKNTEGHPTVSEHQQMADVLIPFIQSKL